jgi:hypothetical protein
MVATADRSINPDQERMMAKRANAKTHNPGFIRILAAGGGRIDRHHDPNHVRRLQDPGGIQ